MKSITGHGLASLGFFFCAVSASSPGFSQVLDGAGALFKRQGTSNGGFGPIFKDSTNYYLYDAQCSAVVIPTASAIGTNPTALSQVQIGKLYSDNNYLYFYNTDFTHPTSCAAGSSLVTITGTAGATGGVTPPTTTTQGAAAVSSTTSGGDATASAEAEEFSNVSSDSTYYYYADHAGNLYRASKANVPAYSSVATPAPYTLYLDGTDYTYTDSAGTAYSCSKDDCDGTKFTGTYSGTGTGKGGSGSKYGDANGATGGGSKSSSGKSRDSCSVSSDTSYYYYTDNAGNLYRTSKTNVPAYSSTTTHVAGQLYSDNGCYVYSDSSGTEYACGKTSCNNTKFSGTFKGTGNKAGAGSSYGDSNGSTGGSKQNKSKSRGSGGTGGTGGTGGGSKGNTGGSGGTGGSKGGGKRRWTDEWAPEINLARDGSKR